MSGATRSYMRLRGDTQVLPFASDATLSTLEANIGALPSVTEMMHQGLSPRDITARLFDGIGVAESSFSLKPE